jgi:hypothetical protein
MTLIDRATERLSAAVPWVHFQAPLTDEPIALSVPEAIAAVLLASIAADGVQTSEEVSRLANGLSTARLFRERGHDRGPAVVARAATLLAEHGREALLEASARTIPPDLRATAFAIATDLVFADGQVDEREKAHVDGLQRVLGLDEALALEIVEAMAIKNRT